MKYKITVWGDFLLTICGMIVMVCAVLLGIRKGYGWDERMYWTVTAILGFLWMRWGIDESRRDKELHEKEAKAKEITNGKS